MYKIVLLRHGESTWSKENRFTGRADAGFTGKGVGAAVAGQGTVKVWRSLSR